MKKSSGVGPSNAREETRLEAAKKEALARLAF
jgi:hypothetical protein